MSSRWALRSKYAMVRSASSDSECRGSAVNRPTAGSARYALYGERGLVVGDRAILSNFRHAERKTEEQHFERCSAIKVSMSTDLCTLPFEGAGDALLDRARHCIWMGYGHRSVREAGPHIQKLFGLEVILLELTNPCFYHLDTVSARSTWIVMYYPNAFSEASRALLESKIPPDKAIVAGEEDANSRL